MKGIFHVTVNRDGVDILNTKFENMILGSGWDHMLTFTPPDVNTPFVNTVFLGDGDTPPAYQDTSLSGDTVAEIQYSDFTDTSYREGDSYSWNGSSNYGTLTFSGIATTQADIREISVGWKDSNKTVLFSRTLLRDNQNQPTTATVAPGDAITITYYLYFGYKVFGGAAKGAAPQYFAPEPQQGETSLWAGVVDTIAKTWQWDGVSHETSRLGATHSTKIANIDHVAKTFDVVIEVTYSAGATITTGYNARYMNFNMQGLKYNGEAFATYTSFKANTKYTYTARFNFGFEWPDALNYLGPFSTAPEITKYSVMTGNTYYRPFYPVYNRNRVTLHGQNRTSMLYPEILASESNHDSAVTSFTRKPYVVGDITPDLVMPSTHVYRAFRTGDVVPLDDWHRGQVDVVKWGRPTPYKLQLYIGNTRLDYLCQYYDITINGREYKWYYNFVTPTGESEDIYGGAVRNDDNTGWLPINIGDVLQFKFKPETTLQYVEYYLPREFELTVPQFLEHFEGMSLDGQTDSNTPPVNFRPSMDAVVGNYSFFSGFYGD